MDFCRLFLSPLGEPAEHASKSHQGVPSSTGMMQGILEKAKRLALTMNSLSFREMCMTTLVVLLCALYACLNRAIEKVIEATRQCGRLGSPIAALWQLFGTLASPMMAAASHQESDAQLFFKCPKVVEGLLIVALVLPSQQRSSTAACITGWEYNTDPIPHARVDACGSVLELGKPDSQPSAAQWTIACHQFACSVCEAETILWTGSQQASYPTLGPRLRWSVCHQDRYGVAVSYIIDRRIIFTTSSKVPSPCRENDSLLLCSERAVQGQQPFQDGLVQPPPGP